MHKNSIKELVLQEIAALPMTPIKAVNQVIMSPDALVPVGSLNWSATINGTLINLINFNYMNQQLIDHQYNCCQKIFT